MISNRLSRREFGWLGVSAAAALGFEGAAALAQGRGAAPAPLAKPDALRSEFLMDLVLETQPAVTIGERGDRTAIAVTGGTFEGPKLKGTVIGPGADWPLRMSETLRILDVRTIL